MKSFIFVRAICINKSIYFHFMNQPYKGIKPFIFTLILQFELCSERGYFDICNNHGIFSKRFMALFLTPHVDFCKPI